MVTKVKTVKSEIGKTHQTISRDARSIAPFGAIADLNTNKQENEPHNGPTCVADMDNLVYLYLSEMGKTTKINATEEKQLGSRIEQGRFLSRLEEELKVKLESNPLPSDIMLELLERFQKTRVTIEVVSQEAGLNKKDDIIGRVTNPLFHQKVDNFLDPIMVGNLAAAAGLDMVQAEAALTELSLINLLIGWPLVESIGCQVNKTGLEEMGASVEFRNNLLWANYELDMHFKLQRNFFIDDGTRSLSHF
jgi:hypothetical protein